MRSDKGSSRLDTLEIKSLIYQTIGNQRAESYFHHIKRFFSLKITKSEFDKSCIKTIAKQNISLHNRLIHSIIKNVSVARSSPSRYPKKGGNFVRLSNGINQIQPLYGDSAFSPSARKCMSRNRLSPLGPLGKPQSITTTSASLGSRPPASVEEGEEVEQVAASPSVQSRSPVTAPLGVSMNLWSRVTSNSFNRETCQSSGELPDTRTLRSRLERRLEMEGIKISMDSVSLLNSGLDAFMRKLIEPCLSLAITRCGNEQSSRLSSCVSLSDFRAGMELHPQSLGEWPILMEKICSSVLDE